MKFGFYGGGYAIAFLLLLAAYYGRVRALALCLAALLFSDAQGLWWIYLSALSGLSPGKTFLDSLPDVVLWAAIGSAVTLICSAIVLLRWNPKRKVHHNDNKAEPASHPAHS